MLRGVARELLRAPLRRRARALHAGLPRLHGGSEFLSNPTISITWKNKDSDEVTTDAHIGMSLLQVAHRNGIDLEGACEGVIACSTCHCILEDEVFDSLEEASEEEEDMLDQAFGLTHTSRLGCQVKITEDMEGMVVTLPAATRNFYVDGHVPQPH
mmetsp:Transcript_12518/g.37634  ORF Transcript_12518/g.37634 Transcript_12518/m.37634 type:complete len:156 (-) Transcript_12518:120-587(-)